MSVFVCGSLHLDVIVQAPGLPRSDETLMGQGVRYDFGGKGGNQAVAAARMGAQVAMAGAIGRDAFGAQLLAVLTGAGIDTTRIALHDQPSGMSVAILDPQGTYGAVVVSGANLLCDGAGPLPPGTTSVLLQNEVPEPANLACATAARAAGARLILNAAPARPMSADLLALVDVLVVNRVEAADLTGLPDPSPQALTALGPGTVILTLGGEGLLLHEADHTRHLPAHRVPVVSTHGAGDAFLGALAAALDLGQDMDAACKFAQAAAALHVSVPVDDRARITSADVARLLA